MIPWVWNDFPEQNVQRVLNFNFVFPQAPKHLVKIGPFVRSEILKVVLWCYFCFKRLIPERSRCWRREVEKNSDEFGDVSSHIRIFSVNLVLLYHNGQVSYRKWIWEQVEQKRGCQIGEVLKLGYSVSGNALHTRGEEIAVVKAACEFSRHYLGGVVDDSLDVPLRVVTRAVLNYVVNLTQEVLHLLRALCGVLKVVGQAQAGEHIANVWSVNRLVEGRSSDIPEKVALY